MADAAAVATGAGSAAGADAGEGTGSGAGEGAGAAASAFGAGESAAARPSSAVSMTAISALLGTVAPSSTRISVRIPANGEGTSALTLSVMTSRSGSYFSTESPGCFSHLPIVPSATLSPSWGIVTLATFAVPPGRFVPGLVSPIRAEPVEPVEPGDAFGLSVRHHRVVNHVGGNPGIADRERRSLLLVAAVFASLEAGRGLGEVGVNTLVLSRLPGDALPYLYIGLGLISLVVAVALGAALGRTRKARLFGVALTSVAVALAVERIALSTGSAAVLPILWLTVTGAGTIAGTIGWTVATSTFDARQAKRLFPICTAAAIAGYFVGSLVAGRWRRSSAPNPSSSPRRSCSSSPPCSSAASPWSRPGGAGCRRRACAGRSSPTFEPGSTRSASRR